MYTIMSLKHFREVDIAHGSKEEMELKCAELNRKYPNENLVVIEVA